MVTSTDLTIDAPVPESTPSLQTIRAVTMRTSEPQPAMEPLRDQQQAYQEEQQP
jgi:hypothetical protein